MQATYLFVLPWSLAFLGGVNQVVLNLAREMIKDGEFTPLVLIPDWDCPTPVWEVTLGIQTVRWRIRHLPIGAGVLGRLTYAVWERTFRQAFGQFVRANNIVAINLHYPGPPAFSLERACRRLAPAVPVLLSFHGADIAAIASAPPAVRAAWRTLLPRCHAVVTCSRDLGEEVSDAFDKLIAPTVVHNGLDAAAFCEKAGPAARQAGRMIFNVAKFEQKKGQDVLIDAFAAIAHDYPDTTLVLAGSPQETYNELLAQGERTGLAHRIEFCPNVPHDDVARMFARASVFVLPSRREPFGIVLLEAGAVGLPVIASNVGGIPEILTDQDTGLLVPADDVAALVAALRRVLDAPAFSVDMGARLQAHVRQNFSWRAACERYLALIRPAAP